jgi:hypothetical protein
MRCKICRKEFSYERALSHHIKKAHTNSQADFKASVETWFLYESETDDDIYPLVVEMTLRPPVFRASEN